MLIYLDYIYLINNSLTNVKVIFKLVKVKKSVFYLVLNKLCKVTNYYLMRNKFYKKIFFQ